MTSYNGASTLQALEGAENYNRAITSLACIEGAIIPGELLLDIGSGGGEFARRLRSYGSVVHCVEPDDGLRAALLADGFPCFPNVSTVEGSFHRIVMINVLEHIEHDRAFLANLRPLLNVGGRLFVFVPAHQILFSRFDKKIGHFRRYSRRQLCAVLSESSYILATTGAFDTLGIVPAYLFKLLKKTEPDPRLIKIYDRFFFPVSLIFDKLTRRLIGKNLWAVGLPKSS